MYAFGHAYGLTYKMVTSIAKRGLFNTVCTEVEELYRILTKINKTKSWQNQLVLATVGRAHPYTLVLHYYYSSCFFCRFKMYWTCWRCIDGTVTVDGVLTSRYGLWTKHAGCSPFFSKFVNQGFIDYCPSFQMVLTPKVFLWHFVRDRRLRNTTERNKLDEIYKLYYSSSGLLNTHTRGKRNEQNGTWMATCVWRVVGGWRVEMF